MHTHTHTGVISRLGQTHQERNQRNKRSPHSKGASHLAAAAASFSSSTPSDRSRFSSSTMALLRLPPPPFILLVMEFRISEPRTPPLSSLSCPARHSASKLCLFPQNRHATRGRTRRSHNPSRRALPQHASRFPLLGMECTAVPYTGGRVHLLLPPSVLSCE